VVEVRTSFSGSRNYRSLKGTKALLQSCVLPGAAALRWPLTQDSKKVGVLTKRLDDGSIVGGVSGTRLILAALGQSASQGTRVTLPVVRNASPTLLAVGARSAG